MPCDTSSYALLNQATLGAAAARDVDSDLDSEMSMETLMMRSFAMHHSLWVIEVSERGTEYGREGMGRGLDE